MKTETFLRKLSVVLTAAILVIGVQACAHHSATEGQDYGQVRTEASSTQSASSDQVVGTAPAPANAQNVEGTTTPAVISGPAKVDSTGRAYTSSSVGAAGNSSGTGLNTNVNIVPEKSASNVTVTQSPAVSTTETTTQTTIAETTPVTTPAPTTVETTTPAPMPETTTTPAPTTVTETQSTTTESAPMTSSTTQESTTTTTTTHRRMRKD
jgi:hypothetical protein